MLLHGEREKTNLSVFGVGCGHHRLGRAAGQASSVLNQFSLLSAFSQDDLHARYLEQLAEVKENARKSGCN